VSSGGGGEAPVGNRGLHSRDDVRWRRDGELRGRPQRLNAMGARRTVTARLVRPAWPKLGNGGLQKVRGMRMAERCHRGEK
jgi:hypothetical protein